jgi:AcrR family transcriptional regulator
VDAARRLLSEGVVPTVEEAADAADISRATAYRYFPNQNALVLATFPEVEHESLLPEHAPPDPVERLKIVTAALARQILAHEPELRAQLRIALEHHHDPQALPFRTGRAIAWIEEALAPLGQSVPAPELHRLVLAIRTAIGIEALVWLTDIGGLTREDAADLMQWSAESLLRHALHESAGPDS